MCCIGATNDRQFGTLDLKSGAGFWSTMLPASADSTLITYMSRDAAQYIVVPPGGDTSIGAGLPTANALVAFKLAPTRSR